MGVAPALQHGVQLVVVRDDQIFSQKLLLDVLVQPLRVEAELNHHHFCSHVHTNSVI